MQVVWLSIDSEADFKLQYFNMDKNYTESRKEDLSV